MSGVLKMKDLTGQVVISGVPTDHGVLGGLADPLDHAWALLIDGTRAMTGNLNMGSNNITSVGTVDGVDVSAHQARHQSGGADALTGDADVNARVAVRKNTGGADVAESGGAEVAGEAG